MFDKPTRRETSLEEAQVAMYLASVSVHRYIGLFTTRISKEKNTAGKAAVFLASADRYSRA